MATLSGQITVTTAGTAVAGPATPTATAIALKAHPDNAGAVWIGNDGEDDVTNANGFPLSPGEGVVLELGSWGTVALSGFYVDADNNGDKACWVVLK
jgi:hypothetical protein